MSNIPIPNSSSLLLEKLIRIFIMLKLLMEARTNCFAKSCGLSLEKNACKINLPWAAIGDFNSVTCKEEVSHNDTYSDQQSKFFKEWINKEALVDIAYTRPRFTWTRGKNDDIFRGARLDRALCSVDWLDAFPESNVTHLPAICFDHNPILLNTNSNISAVKSWSFHFQVAWATHKDFPTIVESSWIKGADVISNVTAMEKALLKWNTESFGNIHKIKRRLEARLEGIQCRISIQRSNNLIKLKRKLKKELEEVLHYEELLWFQRSREEWISSGDRNTKFYHAITRVRKATSRIRGLKNDQGIWESDDDNLKNLVLNHFNNVYKKDQDAPKVSCIPNGFLDVTNHINISFCRDITMEEVKKALFEMSPHKAPGPNEFHAGFYQQAWEIVGEDITRMVDVCVRTGRLQEGTNDTLIALIPKVNNP